MFSRHKRITILLGISLLGIGSVIYPGHWSMPSLEVNGRLFAEDYLSLEIEEDITGDGSIDAPDITIVADKFDFHGIIHCDGTCKISTRKPFDPHIFKRSGRGHFIFSSME
jgi:hypothetical protein